MQCLIIVCVIHFFTEMTSLMCAEIFIYKYPTPHHELIHQDFLCYFWNFLVKMLKKKTTSERQTWSTLWIPTPSKNIGFQNLRKPHHPSLDPEMCKQPPPYSAEAFVETPMIFSEPPPPYEFIVPYSDEVIDFVEAEDTICCPINAPLGFKILELVKIFYLYYIY